MEAEVERIEDGCHRKDVEEDHRWRQEEIGRPLLAHLPQYAARLRRDGLWRLECSAAFVHGSPRVKCSVMGDEKWTARAACFLPYLITHHSSSSYLYRLRMSSPSIAASSRAVAASVSP